jgi:hypothetical protein
VRDPDEFGNWGCVFVTERHIKAAAGSWAGLVVAANPRVTPRILMGPI